MAAVEFKGETFDRLYEELMVRMLAPAHYTLRKWLATGEIFVRCRSEGRPVARPRPPRLLVHQHAELVDEVLLAGEKLFLRHALRGGGWKPDGGRNLLSYYINGCVREFAGVYEQWESAEIRALQVLVRARDDGEDADIFDRMAGTARAVEDTVLERIQADQALSTMPEPLRTVMSLRMRGHTEQEAAEIAGMDKSPQNMLTAWKKKHVRADPEDGKYRKGIV